MDATAKSKLIDLNFGMHATMIPKKANGMNVHQLENLTFVDSGLSCDTFNIIHITNGLNITRNEITLALDHFKWKSLDHCLWINSENLTEQVQAYLEEHSLSQQGSEMGMSLDLITYEPVDSKKHQNIVEVISQNQLIDYANVIASNWTPPDPNVLEYYQNTAAHYLHKSSGVVLLVYYYEGTPLATVELFPTDHETIGIYGLATLEDARGQGIGSALMTFALKKAKELNYKNVVLQASEDGLGIYQKIGFEAHNQYFEFAPTSQ